jgi:hypothetical protein
MLRVGAATTFGEPTVPIAAAAVSMCSVASREVTYSRLLGYLSYRRDTVSIKSNAPGSPHRVLLDGKARKSTPQ